MKQENRDNYVKVETHSFQDMCAKIIALTEENQRLKVDNDFLQRQNRALKLRCGKYAVEIRELNDEVADLRFAQKLYGNPMTPEEVAIDAMENSYVPYTAEDF